MGEFHIPVWENGKNDKSYHGMILVSKWSLNMIPVTDKYLAFNNSTTGASNRAVSAYLSGGIHFTPGFYGGWGFCSTIVCLSFDLWLQITPLLWLNNS